jgi:hypothetical protein
VNTSNVIYLNRIRDNSERRTNLRLKYPVFERPAILINDETFRIHNISETGVKFIGNVSNAPDPETVVRGTIYFTDYNPFEFVGSVVRVIGDLIILRFERPIPTELFKAEVAKFDTKVL